MATLTTNISNVSLTVSGKNTQTATISWTCPTVPAGSTITSCRLTGNASSFTTGNKGATLTINNTSVNSGSSFTINLGTGNNTTSIQASFVGAHKQTSTSVTLSNLVYTVEYTESLPTYTVTFKDWDGSVLKTEEVESGSAATAPSNLSREGYEFTGWDKSFSNITSDLTVTAQYRKLLTVTFADWDGTILKTQTVYEGNTAIPPSNPSRDGYEFIGWSVDFSNVVTDITTVAQYIIIDVLKIKENGNWININKVYKRISGNWVEQGIKGWNTLFDSEVKYIQERISEPTAYLYEDGTLIFSRNDTIDNTFGNVVGTYTGWYTQRYSATSDVPWYSNDRSKINRVYINDIKPSSTAYWFSGNNNLSTIYFNDFDTSSVYDMRAMFHGCSSLTSLDLRGFNTSLVSSMYFMFRDCSSLTSINLSSFNTSNVTDFTSMFYGCSSLTSLSVSNFNTSKATSMLGMFSGCSSLTSLNVRNFNTSRVTKIYGMFQNCSSLTSLDLSNFNTSNATDMHYMFYNCKNLTSLDLSSFNTSKVTDMEYMFYYCQNLTSLDLSSFDTSKVTEMTNMFYGCSSLISLDLSSFDISKISDFNLRNMFYGCTSLQTIYVKDETTKTKIEASTTGLPTGVSVIIGKLN